MSVSWSVNPDDELRIPVLVPAWLVLSDASAQAVRLYCLYKLTVPNFSRPPVHFPQHPREIAAALQIDLEQCEAVHQELIAVGAVEEGHRVDEAGNPRTVLLINDLSPSQRAEEARRQTRLAELRAEKEANDQARTVAKGVVYVIAQVGTSRVKIGYTRNIASRLKTLQTSNPYKLEVLWQTSGDMRLEEALHRRFAKHRSQGEWFEFGRLNPVKAVEAAVNEIQAAQ
ncbi:GIY-YIG nuclease family protein [Amycolatopsis sp. NPDC059657]|uniref:GIY-YIG nuclease family protein n=1 Tax=Amycolatopsis sp. NPDC059657 TaxID=3346899 RepID=UPI003672675B